MSRVKLNLIIAHMIIKFYIVKPTEYLLSFVIHFRFLYTSTRKTYTTNSGFVHN